MPIIGERGHESREEHSLHPIRIGNRARNFVFVVVARQDPIRSERLDDHAQLSSSFFSGAFFSGGGFASAFFSGGGFASAFFSGGGPPRFGSCISFSLVAVPHAGGLSFSFA